MERAASPEAGTQGERAYLKKLIQENTIGTADQKSIVLVRRLARSLKSCNIALPQLVQADVDSIESASQTHHLRTYCILTDINKLDQFDKFTTAGVHDSQLPIEVDILIKLFGTQDTAYLVDFCEHQWSFIAPILDATPNQSFRHQVILPICRRGLLSVTFTSTVYEVLIPEEFLSEETKVQIDEQCRFSDNDLCPTKSYILALKEFQGASVHHGSLESTFVDKKLNAEGKIFHKSILQHLGTFTVYEAPETVFSYNILMQIGTTDFESQLSSNKFPAASRSEIWGFWNEISGLIDAVSTLHRGFVTTDPNKAKLMCNVFYHHDIKPANILLFQDCLKLTDFGYAGMVSVDSSEHSQAESKVLPSGFGTVSYGPPEFLKNSTTTLKKLLAFDIWSLGCVISEAATWVALGPSGVKQFRRLRVKASHNVRDATRVGDYFHDGEKVLRVVSEWHQYIRSVLRISDSVTSIMLEIVDKKLLVDAEQRADAESLHREVTTILDMSGTDDAYQFSEETGEMLDAIEGASSETDSDRLDD